MNNTVFSGRAVEYCRWCLKRGNHQVPKYVKLQARDWLKIAEGRDREAHVDEERYEKICGLLHIMVHPDLHVNMYDGLEDYAFFFIIAVLCTMDGNGLRFYETAVLEIARKNFKTFNSAVIFVLLLLTEPRFSRFFSVAPDLKLSSELKLAIRKIIKSSPELEDEEVFKVLRSEIRCLVTDSEYTPLAYSEDKLDGKLANAFLADEAGAMDGYPIEAMESSQITLDSKLGIIISTQYPNDDNGMIDEIDISKKTLDGLLDDRRRFSLLYEPDQRLLTDDQWMSDDTVIYQSNPVAVKNVKVFKAVKKLRAMAVLYPNRRENFLCKHCNIKYKGLGVQGYVEITAVRACSVAPDRQFWKDKYVYVGMDLSTSNDNTAVAMATLNDDVISAKVWGFIPGKLKDAKSNKEGVNYDKLERDGVCLASGDYVISYLDVERLIIELESQFGCTVVQVGYDPWNAISTVQKLEAEGIECVEIKQHSSVLHSPTKLLMEKILSGKFRYEQNQLLEINFENARCTEDTNKNKYVNKKKSAGKVDMVVALINAVYLLEQATLYGGNDFVVQM